ncbi:MAG: shikimate dehydrogenase [Muribaculaceae bacterium]|nr:shikimate dehydrogenase [Muribaculaceae bacterium]
MYGLIGKKLGHSFSANFFNTKFKNEGINESYRLFPLNDIELLPSLISSNPELKGLNVTIPYKEAVIPYLDHISPDAEEIGAVNVIKISSKKEKTILEGYNTDWIGFKDALTPFLNEKVDKALILGTGGASKAVYYALKTLGIEATKVSRTPSPDYLRYSDLDESIIRSRLLIINTTPLGMFPENHTLPFIPYEYLTDEHLMFDLVYNPSITEFMKKGAEKRALTINGLQMLHNQAIEAWKIWSE